MNSIREKLHGISIKEKDNTIKGTIQQYFAENTMIVLCIFLSCMIITAMISMEYQQENSSLLRLNDFYEQMKENNYLLHYVFSNVGEGEEELLDHIAQTAEILEEIQNSQVSETFYRDVDDIRNIYSGYYESAKQMIQCDGEEKHHRNLSDVRKFRETD